MTLINDWGSQLPEFAPGEMYVRPFSEPSSTDEARTSFAIEGLSTDGKWCARAFLAADQDRHLAIARLELWPSSTTIVGMGAPVPAGINGDTMRHLPLGRWLAEAFGQLTDAEFLARTGSGYDPLLEAMGHTDTSAERIAWARQVADAVQAVPLRRRGRRGYPDDHYRRIALAYLDLQQQGVSRGIQHRLAEQERKQPETIRDWLHIATKKGFLTPGKQGRAGGRHAGPNLYPVTAPEEIER
jgi:hypothetical protein